MRMVETYRVSLDGVWITDNKGNEMLLDTMTLEKLYKDSTEYQTILEESLNECTDLISSTQKLILNLEK